MISAAHGKARRPADSLADPADVAPHDVDPRALRAVAALLLLVQLPHATQLPIWVTVVGLALVVLRLVHERGANPRRRDPTWLSTPILSGIAIAAVALVVVHYGYLFGRDPGVALLYILTAARFAEWRRQDQGGFLVCLGAFLLLTQYFYSQSLLSAMLTLPAVIALGNALMVLRDPDDGDDLRARVGLVARLLLQGAPIATLLFLAFPRLPGPLWSMPDDAIGQTGLSDTMTPGSIGALSQSDAVAFRVEFADAVPPPRAARYWRGPVLERFDGRSWSASPVERGAPPPSPSGDVLDYTVTLPAHGHRWLFALEQATVLPGALGGATNPALRSSYRTRTAELMLVEPVTSALSYRASSILSPRLTETTRPDRTNTMPPPGNPRTLALGERLRREATSAPRRVAAALALFRDGDFGYTLRPGVYGDAPLDEFLFERRAGFCEHFASAFVALMRAAGIPARVVTGYLGGEMNGDYMIVRQSDAHAWAEVWIDGAWLRVDPTAAVAPARIASGLESAIDDPAALPMLARGTHGWLARWRLRWDTVNHHWQRFVIDFDRGVQERLLARLGLGLLASWQIAGLVAGVAACWVLAVLAWTHARAPIATDPLERVWQRVGRLLERQVAARLPAETSTTYLSRVAASRPDLAKPIDAFAAEFRALRFERLDHSTRILRMRRLRVQVCALHRALILSRCRIGRPEPRLH